MEIIMGILFAILVVRAIDREIFSKKEDKPQPKDKK